jgi:hypothetical protein
MMITDHLYTAELIIVEYQHYMKTKVFNPINESIAQAINSFG